MTYIFPECLTSLRDHLHSIGADIRSFSTARQAAFMAQQLLGTRIKFPPQGKDMLPTLLLIQQAVPARHHLAAATPQTVQLAKARQPSKDTSASKFPPSLFAKGTHIFCDGASIPNPGAGGWGVVVYRDGVEVASQAGGDPDATNNAMELTGLLVAIEMASQLGWDEPVTIWCDSKYCVEGVNVWMKTWKAKGWSKRKIDSSKRGEGGIKNLELWQAIDAALASDPNISVCWVKGHCGVAGNERADELADHGRMIAIEEQMDIDDPLLAEFRQIMGAA